MVWLRSFSLVFGVTVYAASTVLAGFMAGLALGSYAAGRLAGRLRRPLVAFALAELGVGLTALLVPVAMRVLERGYLVLNPLLPESFAVVTAVRFVLAFAVLVVPTSLMGATLPLLVRAVGPYRRPRFDHRRALRHQHRRRHRRCAHRGLLPRAHPSG